MEGAILLQNVQGAKYDHGSSIYGPGELLVKYFQDGYHFNYQLHRDRDVYLFCEEDDVKSLNTIEFSLLEAIMDRGERLKAFKDKLEWGLFLEEGSSVSVTIPADGLSLVKHQTTAIIRHRGKVGSHPGILFGVEILV